VLCRKDSELSFTSGPPKEKLVQFVIFCTGITKPGDVDSQLYSMKHCDSAD